MSADGTLLFYPKAPAVLVTALPVTGPAASRTPTIVLQSTEGVANARFSPARAGTDPTWRRDGQEIVFLSQLKVWSVRVDGGGDTIRFSPPEPLFDVGPYAGVSDISVLAMSRDGSRFYLPQTVPQPGSDMIHVRLGWLMD